MMKTLLSVCLLVFISANPAFAQSKKELAAQNAALAQRLSALESRLLTGDPAAERLMQRIDALETQHRTLTGEVERLRFERDTLVSEVKALSDDVRAIQDVANRMQLHLDATAQSSPGYQNTYNAPASPQPLQADPYASNPYGAPQTSPDPYASGPITQPSQIPGPPMVNEQTIPVQEQYRSLSQLPATGKQKLAEGDFAGAQQAFRDYLTVMPDAPDAGEINFWLGETYYVRGGYAAAAESYIASMRKAPQGGKAPDAMIRLGATLRELGKIAEACQTLNSFPVQYPNAPANVQNKARTELIRTGC